MSDIDNIAVHNLFGIEGLNIAWYGIIMAAAIVVGVWVACRQAKKKGYSSELIFDFMILAIPLAIVGARLYYVAFEWDYYSRHPEEIIAVWNGGIAIYGCIMGALLAGFILSKWRKFPFGRLMDFIMPGAAIGQAIGRWGNFVNQEAFGNIVTDPNLQWFPYAVYVKEKWTGTMLVTDSWVQATFFYESMWDLGVFALLLWYSKRARYDGSVFALYLVGYGSGRLWIEGIRVSTLQLWPGMPVSQFVSLIIIAIGVIMLVYDYVKKPQPRPYSGLYALDGTAGPKPGSESESARKDRSQPGAATEGSGFSGEDPSPVEAEPRGKDSPESGDAEPGEEGSDPADTEPNDDNEKGDINA